MTVKSILIQELKNAGITNKYSIAAILSIVAKESSFKPQSETTYSTTSNDRIKSIFSITRAIDDTQLNTLKKDPVKFFNYVYGGKMGNSNIEGFTYRGRGLNQLTGKNNYRKFGDLLKFQYSLTDKEQLNKELKFNYEKLNKIHLKQIENLNQIEIDYLNDPYKINQFIPPSKKDTQAPTNTVVVEKTDEQKCFDQLSACKMVGATRLARRTVNQNKIKCYNVRGGVESLCGEIIRF
jgi:predicted chitinase